MIITRGLGASRLVTRGYGPDVAPPLSEIDTSALGLTKRKFSSLTRSRVATVISKQRVEGK
jgi:hypothetical protein